MVRRSQWKQAAWGAQAKTLFEPGQGLEKRPGHGPVLHVAVPWEAGGRGALRSFFANATTFITHGYRF